MHAREARGHVNGRNRGDDRWILQTSVICAKEYVFFFVDLYSYMHTCYMKAGYRIFLRDALLH